MFLLAVSCARLAYRNHSCCHPVLLHNLSSYSLRPDVFLPYMIGSIASAPTVKAMTTPPTHPWALRHVFREAPGGGGGGVCVLGGCRIYSQ